MNLCITGTGAVSPAGWGVEAMMDALRSGTLPAAGLLERTSGPLTISTPVLRVPADQGRVPKSPRLRRASPISKFVAAAAMEALGEPRLAGIPDGLRVGVILTLSNGCVNYSNRFFGEVLADPAVASPILFPETVFNAPSSHLSAMIGSTAPNDSLIGDGSGFLTGIDLAAEWLERDEVDGCLVVAAEEADWLSAEALGFYSRSFLPSEGAAAIYLEKGDGPVLIESLPDPVSCAGRTRREAAIAMRRLLEPLDHDDLLLIDSRTGIDRFDQAEAAMWSDWQGPCWSPKKVLGESFGASAAFQVVAAVEALKSGICGRAVVSAIGPNQQAAGMLLARE